MELLKFVRLIVVLVPMVSGKQFNREEISETSLKNDQRIPMDPQQGLVMCTRLSKEPYFGVEMLLGKPWRIYYTWNINFENQCLDMTFTNATPTIVNRFFNDMNEYMETSPYWDAATLLVRMGSLKHEMLLFADQGAAGTFQGVPNVMRDGSISPAKQTVPLLKFHLKLLYGGKYLLMADCNIGVTTLSTRRGEMPYRAEIGGIASNLDIGPGLSACRSDKIKNEEVPQEN